MKGLTLNELIQWRPPYQEYIIASDILLTQGTMCLYGAEGVWKSMLVLDMTFRIALGKDWFDFKTFTSPVYNFQSETPQGPLRKRAMKFALGNDMTSDNFWLCSELYEKIDKGWGYSELEKEIKRTNPKVLIIDSMYNSVSAKLVDDYEIGMFLDKMNQLRADYKLAIIFVHHSRQAEHSEGETYHYGTEEMFGSSRLRRWFDTIIYVELRNDGEPLVDLRLTFEKTRHTEGKLAPIDVEVNRTNLTFKRKDIIGGI